MDWNQTMTNQDSNSGRGTFSGKSESSKVSKKDNEGCAGKQLSGSETVCARSDNPTRTLTKTG